MNRILVCSLLGLLVGISGCSKEAKVVAEGKGDFEVSRAEEPTPEVQPVDPPQFMTGSIAEPTITAGNFEIGRVELEGEVCGKLLSQQKLNPRQMKLKLQLGAARSDTDSCNVKVYPVKGQRVGYAYIRVEDTNENKAARQAERQAKSEREAAELMQKFADLKTMMKDTVGKSWDIKFASGGSDRWTLTQLDGAAQFKDNANERVMVMFNPDEKKWFATGAGCVYELNIEGTAVSGKATFCQQAAKSAFTGTIVK
jgi:hypothetical protein